MFCDSWNNGKSINTDHTQSKASTDSDQMNTAVVDNSLVGRNNDNRTQNLEDTNKQSLINSCCLILEILRKTNLRI